MPTIITNASKELPGRSTVYLLGNSLASKPIKLVVQCTDCVFCPHSFHRHFAALSLVGIREIVY